MTELRINQLKMMNDHILNLGDEDIYETWFMCGVPDCPSFDDYEFIASDEDEYNYVCELFYKLCKRAAEEEEEE